MMAESCWGKKETGGEGQGLVSFEVIQQKGKMGGKKEVTLEGKKGIQ